jgi:type VI secretion system secreted protein VgrG
VGTTHAFNPQWLRTSSTPGGVGTNELRFEDEKGKEQLRWQAEKDWDAKIGNSSHSQIDGTHERAIGGDDYREIQGEQHIRLEGNSQKAINLNQHCTLHGSQEQHIEQNSLIQAGQSVVWQSQNQAIYHAGVELTLQAGGSFIKLDPSGITLSGPVVMMNQGGSALSAGSEAATLPHKPAGAHSAGVGKVPRARAPETVTETEDNTAFRAVSSV